MKKKRIIAMILAGGQGTRLKELTEDIAKPAVAFGGKYRIIDFTLTNCSNSGIDTVGVLTQYEPHILNNHIGRGSPWDLDRMDGGVTVLQPHTRKNDEKGWYKGTANAIYQNIKFIEEYDPEYVLILSGDHIYKMNYDKMLQFHIQKNADVTIGVFKVPMSDAPSFGIMNTKEDMSIYEFEEKPKEPKSDLASMGIYIFNWQLLKKYLDEDEKDVNTLEYEELSDEEYEEIYEDDITEDEDNTEDIFEDLDNEYGFGSSSNEFDNAMFDDLDEDYATDEDVARWSFKTHDKNRIYNDDYYVSAEEKEKYYERKYYDKA